MYIFEQTQKINKPLDEVFEFFSKLENLGKITPNWLKFEIKTSPEQTMKKNAVFIYKIKFHNVPMKWKTLITKYEPPYLFVDEQAKGPYKKWVHTHTFEEVNGFTVMSDKVEYDLYGGIFKSIVHSAFVKNSIVEIFSYRKKIISEVFESE